MMFGLVGLGVVSGSSSGGAIDPPTPPDQTYPTILFPLNDEYGVTTPEGAVMAITLEADEPVTWSFEAGGSDNGLCEIYQPVAPSTTATLRWLGNTTRALSPAEDSNGDNKYDVFIKAVDGAGLDNDVFFSIYLTDADGWLTVYEPNTSIAQDLTAGGLNTRLFINAGAMLRGSTYETRVTFWGGSATDLDIQNASIGQLSGLANPDNLSYKREWAVPLLFSGNPDVVVSSNSTVTSDAVVCPFSSYTPVGVHINHNATSQMQGLVQSGSTSSTFSKSVAGDESLDYDTPNSGGEYGSVSARSYGISKIEVRDTATPPSTPPVITSSSTASVSEDVALAHTLTTDVGAVTWTLASVGGGNTDYGQFEVYQNYILRFASNGVKDFEAPSDFNADNDYEVRVRATDAWGNYDEQDITVSVTDSGAGVWMTTIGDPSHYFVNSNNTGWNGKNLRCFLPASLISKPGVKFRLTLKAASGEGAQVASMYAGHGAPSGDNYDFDGTQVQVTVSGSPTFTVSAGSTVVTDEITYTVDDTKPFVISAYFNNAANDGILVGNSSGSHRYYSKVAADESSTADVTGYTDAGAGTCAFVSNVEVLKT